MHGGKRAHESIPEEHSVCSTGWVGALDTVGMIGEGLSNAHGTCEACGAENTGMHIPDGAEYH